MCNLCSNMSTYILTYTHKFCFFSTFQCILFNLDREWRHKPHFIFRFKLILHEHAQHKTIHNWLIFVFLNRFIFHSWCLLFIYLQLYMCLSHHTILYQHKLLALKIIRGSIYFSVRQRLFNTRIHFVSITSYF